MSGILGVWNSRKPAPWQQMLQDLRVLGPDGSGDWQGCNGQLSLGRTQFFDTPESCFEPPVIEYAGCVLVWSGRIDDRDALLTVNAPPQTDAQLLIESYRRWGMDCIDRLVGEFAFILWDAANDLLLVGCDPVGNRTVAYSWDGQTLLVSSRVLTLLLHPQVSPELDPLYLAHTLSSLNGHQPGSTPFQDIRRLVPGSALILKAGQLQVRQITQLASPNSYDTARSAQSYYDEFWDILNKSVKDRLRNVHRPCTTLSGGLDSTTVTVALLQQLTQIDAFSTVTDIHPEFDERESIETFLQQYPQTNWHPVNSDQAWSFSESRENLPLTDDPLMTCTLDMNVHLMKQIQQQGFGLIFDGEWGDEICAIDFPDLIQAGRWRATQRYMQNQERSWRWVLGWEMILPRLMKGWQQKFVAWRQPVSLPSWLTSDYAQDKSMQMAIEHSYQSNISGRLSTNISWAMSSGYSVAIMQAYNLIYAAHNLQTTSPLQDRRLINLMVNLPPDLQIDVNHEKIFLRQAGQNYLPPAIQWKPKDNYFDPMKYVGLGQGQPVLEILDRLQDTDCLNGLVDISQVKKMLLDYRVGYAQSYCPGQPYRNQEANQLHDLFNFVNWHHRVTHRLCLH
jgi:asparagine synthase (glutamine-hydrolysing)